MKKFFTLLLFSEIACTIDTKYKNLDEAYGRNHIDRRKRYEESNFIPLIICLFVLIHSNFT